MIKQPTATAVVFIALFASGCAHHNLAYDHVKQAKMLSKIHERQVLDNLAMFLDNPEALPFYAMPGAGSNVVADSGSLAASPLNGPTHTVLGPLRLSRDNRLTWATSPINDPAKLERMKCAYRRAIGLNAGSCCVDCCEITAGMKTPVCCDCCSIRPLKIERCAKNLIYKPCEKTGTYCGTHIRVCPESYGDFNRLVTAIMDFALNDPPASQDPPTMQIERYLYDGDSGRLAEVQKYTVEAKKSESGDVVPGDPVAAPEIAPSPSPSMGGLNQIPELQILREAVAPMSR